MPCAGLINAIGCYLSGIPCTMLCLINNVGVVLVILAYFAHYQF